MFYYYFLDLLTGRKSDLVVVRREIDELFETLRCQQTRAQCTDLTHNAIRPEMTMSHTFRPVTRDSRLLSSHDYRLLQIPVRTTKWKCAQNQT